MLALAAVAVAVAAAAIATGAGGMARRHQVRFTRCAVFKVNETCRFEGLRSVRYGRPGHQAQKAFYGGAPCSPRAFGLKRPGRPSDRCAYGPLKTVRLADPMVGMTLSARSVRVPRGAPGHRTMRIRATSVPAAPYDIGAFRIRCLYSHMAFDDPIVHAGQPGASHLHLFFGNTRVDADSTTRSIESSGASTCAGGILDRSAYWVPAVVDPARKQAILPLYQRVYYKTGYLGVPPAIVRPIPRGLRMIAGDARASAPQSAAGWDCQSPPGARYFRYHQASIPRSCPPGALVIQSLMFPQCWDGRNLDSPDHKSHMAVARAGCPASHPVPLPLISYKIVYQAPARGSLRRWRLASDEYPADRPGGLSGHGDFVNGWNLDVEKTWNQRCLQSPHNCQGGQLGDGRTIF